MRGETSFFVPFSESIIDVVTYFGLIWSSSVCISFNFVLVGAWAQMCRFWSSDRFIPHPYLILDKRRLQCIARQMLARKAVARGLADARAARKAGEDLRLRRRRREAEALHRYKEACREEGRK